MSIPTIEPLTVEPVSPVDPDWFEEEDTAEAIARRIEAHCEAFLSRFTNDCTEMIVVKGFAADLFKICAGIARSHR